MTPEDVIVATIERLRAQGQDTKNYRKGWDDGPADGHISLLSELSHLMSTVLARTGGISKNFSTTLVADQESYDIDLTVNEMIGEVWWVSEDGDERRTLKRISYADYINKRWADSAFIDQIFPNPEAAAGTPYAYCLGDDRDDSDTTSAIIVLPRPATSGGLVKFTATYTPAVLARTTNLNALLQTGNQHALIDLLNAHILHVLNPDPTTYLDVAGQAAVDNTANDKGGPDSNLLTVKVYGYYAR